MSSDHSFCNCFSNEFCSMKNAQVPYSFLLIYQGEIFLHQHIFFHLQTLLTKRRDFPVASYFSKQSYPNTYEKYVFAKDVADMKRVIVYENLSKAKLS